MLEVVQSGPGSASAAWRALSDVESWPELLPTVSEVSRRGRLMGTVIGARFLVAQPRLQTVEYVVTDVDPGRAFTWRARGPGLTTTARHRVEATDDGTCRVSLSIEWRGAVAWIARLGYTKLAVDYMTKEAAAVLRVAAAAAERPVPKGRGRPVED
ncbi:SRPBCC family protein [Kribbella sp. VKM Ac-2571]|uniref:SRPBCC family protein n=1 Tax=Kribbella sp. VKM Ac-2571 TaxID=2512222 RepID=UPI001414E168|nr:SRPBCC family protein [Kribbella sp. VKM Ac-2571]